MGDKLEKIVLDPDKIREKAGQKLKDKSKRESGICITTDSKVDENKEDDIEK